MAPVGSYESLRAAIAAGANSVYFGIGQLNMRSASAANFTADDMAEINRIAHEHGVKTYLTVNTIVYDTELQQMHDVVDRAKAEGVDAIIASDMSVILYAYQVGVEVHISTQCNISNSEAAKFYSQWADVVVLARELSLEQIAMVKRAIVEQDIRGPKGELLKIEMFSHGALCMSISGKCYLSEHETACSANRGACRQICRRKYTIPDKDSGQQLDVDGQYVLSPKDLCTIDFLDTFTSNVLLPLSGLSIVIFMAWVLGRKALADELTTGGRYARGLVGPTIFLLRYVVPLMMVVLILNLLGIV